LHVASKEFFYDFLLAALQHTLYLFDLAVQKLNFIDLLIATYRCILHCTMVCVVLLLGYVSRIGTTCK
jgi:hypothetical protein